MMEEKDIKDLYDTRSIENNNPIETINNLKS